MKKTIDKETYESKYTELMNRQEELLSDRKKLEETSKNEKETFERV